MSEIIALKEVQQVRAEAATREIGTIVNGAVSQAFTASLKACVKHRWPAELTVTVELFLATLRAELEELEQLEQKRRVGS